jgi:hypothetical protein
VERAANTGATCYNCGAEGHRVRDCRFLPVFYLPMMLIFQALSHVLTSSLARIAGK